MPLVCDNLSSITNRPSVKIFSYHTPHSPIPRWSLQWYKLHLYPVKYPFNSLITLDILIPRSSLFITRSTCFPSICGQFQKSSSSDNCHRYANTGSAISVTLRSFDTNLLYYVISISNPAVIKQSVGWPHCCTLLNRIAVVPGY